MVTKRTTSSNNEAETITETPPECLSGVPRLKQENAFIVTDFPARKKSLMFTPAEDNYLNQASSDTAMVNGKRFSGIPNFVFKREGQPTHC